MKGVYLTHENIITNIFQHRQRLPEMFQNHQTVAALITPFFHILGLGVFVCQYICQVRVLRVPVSLYHTNPGNNFR
jgi:acyl-CoA synthetase (AMP-forming)/AMP-acid ligase II